MAGSLWGRTRRLFYIAEMRYEDFDEDLGLRDLLALDRTILANERTTLAYARTAVMLGVSAVTLFKVFPDSRWAQTTGVALIPLALIVGVFGAVRYFSLAKSLKRRRNG